MKIYLSGLNNVSTPEILEYVKESGVNVLLSYFHHARQNPVVIRHRWAGCGVFIDSGGFSVRMYGVQIPVKRYRDFLVRLGSTVDACVNLDPLDFDEAMANLRFLQKAGLNPMPVYHITDWQDRRYRSLIKSWCEEYEYVAVSGLSYKSVTTRKMSGPRVKGKVESPYHDYIFNEALKHKTKIHGLAATNQTLLGQYPFYSADSTTWKNSDRYGVVHEFIEGRLIHHAGERTKTGRARNPLVRLPKTQRMLKSIEAWMKFEAHLTKLWAERGISW